MRASEFEDRVWEVEGIRIVLRTREDTEVGDYDYQRAADSGWQITELAHRIEGCLGNGDISYVVIQGNGEMPHGNAILRTIRDSYARR